VPYGNDGAVPEHAWSCVAHSFSDSLASLWAVAVGLAELAEGLSICLKQVAVPVALNGVLLQVSAGSAEIAACALMLHAFAVYVDHKVDDHLLVCQPSNLIVIFPLIFGSHQTNPS